MLKKYGYIRVGAIVNQLKVADITYNLSEIKKLLLDSVDKGIEIVTFPELSLCGYTSQDLFLNEDFYHKCMDGIYELKEFSKNLDLVFIIGAPCRVMNALYNCAYVFYQGYILGITPKTYIPNYSEYYEYRYFSSGDHLNDSYVRLWDEEVLISNHLIYQCESLNLSFAIELCEDLWMNQAVSNTMSNHANLIFNLSGSNEIVGKVGYRRNLVKMQSAKCLVGYVYASCGVFESTSDLCYSGHAMICEPNGEFIENERFSLISTITYTDIDIARINQDRLKMRTFEQQELKDEYPIVYFNLSKKENELLKKYSKKPFVQHSKEAIEEILNIQTYALVKRIMHIGSTKLIVGISGGLDSTLAFLICLRACKALKMPASNIIAITMPGFGTSQRTYQNAKNLILECKATYKEISIKEACIQHFKDINHDINTFDITYENSQARERTQILFDVANQEQGIVIGTGDLSELALGWATYNGDHMSNYAINCSIPKTLVASLIQAICDESEGVMAKTLEDILHTPISPELLPLDEKGNIKQDTQASIGPYVLHDFFLYHFMRYGASVKKIYFLAVRTFKDEYTPKEVLNTLKVFIKRFFSQQFKRNCIPDGVKVGSVSLSPRGDLRMSSDTSANLYLEELESL